MIVVSVVEWHPIGTRHSIYRIWGTAKFFFMSRWTCPVTVTSTKKNKQLLPFTWIPNLTLTLGVTFFLLKQMMRILFHNTYLYFALSTKQSMEKGRKFYWIFIKYHFYFHSCQRLHFIVPLIFNSKFFLILLLKLSIK